MAEGQKKAYAAEVRFDEQLKELRFPPPENGREGGIVDWYKRDGELRVELMCVEEDGMSGRKKATTLGKLPPFRLRDFVDKDKAGGVQKKSLKDEWLPMAGKAGMVHLSIILELPSAGAGASARVRPKGESRAEKRAAAAAAADSTAGSSYASLAAGMKTSADDVRRSAQSRGGGDGGSAIGVAPSHLNISDALEKKLDQAYRSGDKPPVGRNVNAALKKVVPKTQATLVKMTTITKFLQRQTPKIGRSDTLTFARLLRALRAHVRQQGHWHAQEADELAALPVDAQHRQVAVRTRHDLEGRCRRALQGRVCRHLPGEPRPHADDHRRR